MKYFILLAKAAHLFFLGWLADLFAHILDKRLENRLREKKPLSGKALAVHAKLCETLFRKWQKHETNYLLFQSGFSVVHSHDDF